MLAQYNNINPKHVHINNAFALRISLLPSTLLDILFFFPSPFLLHTPTISPFFLCRTLFVYFPSLSITYFGIHFMRFVTLYRGSWNVVFRNARLRTNRVTRYGHIAVSYCRSFYPSLFQRFSTLKVISHSLLLLIEENKGFVCKSRFPLIP